MLSALPSPDVIQVALTLSTLLVIWVGWVRYLGPRLKHRTRRLVGFFQTIAGRDPIVDKITGKEVSPAVPPLGEQIAAINDNMAQLIEVVRSNQDAHHRIDGIEGRVGGVEGRVGGLEIAMGMIAGEKFERAGDAAMAAVEKAQAGTVDAEPTE